MRKTDFFRYLTPLPRDEIWGAAVIAGGEYTAVPGAVYPPDGHPRDHHFEWDAGRTLDAYQILYIIAGQGSFESRQSGEIEVEAGQILIILPGIWHRYRPDRHLGWREQWIELRGNVLADLETEGILNPYDPLSVIREAAIGTLFHKILSAIRSGPVRPEPVAGAWALQILAQLHSERTKRRVPKPITTALAKAEQLMSGGDSAVPRLEGLADELGMAYSHFRRAFKGATGTSPGKYLRRLRLEKARRLVDTTSEPMKAIANTCGFSSEFHFSSAFKKQFGLSPGKWRSQSGPGGVLF